MTEANLDSFSFQIEQLPEGFKVNGQTINPDISKVNDRLFHVILNNKSYNIFIHQINRESSEVTISVNGKKGIVKIRSRVEKLLEALGMDQVIKKKLESVKAPMPGLIQRIEVNPGDQVHKGDPLLILEAMKMENVIKSPGDGVISRIHVEEKASVEKNELLITFD